LDRSALAEAAEQFSRALDQISRLPSTPALRREQIKLQVALLNPLGHVKGWAASETKAAVEHARQLVQEAEDAGEAPEDPLLLFSVLYSFWVANLVGCNGDALKALAAQFVAVAEKQNATGPSVVGHRLNGMSLLITGDIAQSRAYFDKAVASYNAVEHRGLAARFGQDIRVACLSYRPVALWLLGYPNAAAADIDAALKSAGESGQAATLMYALSATSAALICSGSYMKASAILDELMSLADEKGSALWKPYAIVGQGQILALTGHASKAVETIASGLAGLRTVGSTFWMPSVLLAFAKAYSDLGQSDDAWRCVNEGLTTIEQTKESWFEAEACRIAGEIALASPSHDTKKAYFDRALSIAHHQRAKSWELRAAMSMARLWRDQGKRREARDLLAPVYGWFTEGFDTRDLKEAKALLELAA
jgi:predicted ATPase